MLRILRHALRKYCRVQLMEQVTLGGGSSLSHDFHGGWYNTNHSGDTVGKAMGSTTPQIYHKWVI